MSRSCSVPRFRVLRGAGRGATECGSDEPVRFRRIVRREDTRLFIDSFEERCWIDSYRQSRLSHCDAETRMRSSPWGGTFLDTFRYLDQLGRLAKQEVRVVAHNTLVASDSGLLKEKTFTPKPNYWAALLWRRFMGTTVLDSGVPIHPGLHVYAQCLRGTPGGVAVLVINNDKRAARTLAVPTAGERYTLSATALESKSVLLNGTELVLGQSDALPAFTPSAIAAGNVTLAPTTITFMTIPTAANGACR